jgi:FixJ family two-component response regulator
VSGHGGTQLAQAAAAIGVNEVLSKPLQRRDLAESVARVLGGATIEVRRKTGRSP